MAQGVTALPEITVTAEHRVENVQRTPIAIQTVTGEQIAAAGINDPASLQRLVPGLNIRPSGPGAESIYIRGVGSNVGNSFQDIANAFSIDGVFLARAAGPDTVFYDLERLEVLKGPQGTLYGRNATGGALNILTKRPDLNAFGGDVSVELGNYGLRHFNGAVNIPLIDGTLAARIAANVIKRDGYFDDGLDDADTQAVRANVLWKPTDDLKVFLSADYAIVGGKGPGRIYRGPDPGLAPIGASATNPNSVGNGNLATEWPGGDPWSGECGAGQLAYYTSRVAAGGRSTTLWDGAGGYSPIDVFRTGVPRTDCSPFADNTFWSVAGTLDWNLPFGALTVIGAHRDSDIEGRYSPSPEMSESTNLVKQDTFEARLASNGSGPLKWIVGAFYFRETQDFRGLFESGPNTTCLQTAGANAGVRSAPNAVCKEPGPRIGSLTGEVGPQAFQLNDWNGNDTKSWAVFSQGTYSLTDALRVTAGVRYTEEERQISPLASSTNYFFRTATTFATERTVFLGDSHKEFTSTNYRVGVEYDLTDHNLLYANVATGFHGGGLNPGGPVTATGAVNTYDPESLKAYAIGSKNRFFDGRLQINSEIFYWDYDKLQVAGLTLISSQSFFVTTNAGRAHIFGIDTDFSALITADDLISGTILWNHSEYDSFTQLQGPLLRVFTGRQIAANPQWNATLAYEHTFNLAGGGRLVAGARTQYNDDTFYMYTQEPGTEQKAFFRTDLDLTYHSPQDRWRVAAYVRNVSDEVIITSANSDSAVTGTPPVTLAAPRTYGVTLSAKF